MKLTNQRLINSITNITVYITNSCSVILHPVSGHCAFLPSIQWYIDLHKAKQYTAQSLLYHIQMVHDALPASFLLVLH